jgi:hypothetical protein
MPLLETGQVNFRLALRLTQRLTVPWSMNSSLTRVIMDVRRRNLCPTSTTVVVASRSTSRPAISEQRGELVQR